ncbi:MAG TPA: MerC domain-containing protein [Sphingomonas sp.]|nr:MerC domain-containing protein [Sphingomonas sp.]
MDRESPRDREECAEALAASRLDRLAIGLSSLCLVHCIATVALAAALASVSAVLARPIFHEVGFALAILLGAVALGRGYAVHRSPKPLAIGIAGLVLMGLGLSLSDGLGEIAVTMAGVTLLALAHRLNVGQHAHSHALAGACPRP